MRKFQRLNAPVVIEQNWEEIGTNYQARRQQEPNYKFSWPQRDNVKFNHAALPILIQQTDDHCSYCDNYPPLKGDYSIDHFKPKTNPLYYLIVCHWPNLYLACKHCQDSKLTQYDDLLLRPDDGDFSFERYFTYNYKEHKVEVNPAASDYDKLRADKTIEIFDFNFPSVKTSRRHAFERYNGNANPDLNDYNYRFIFE